ncbi:glycosyltransferase family 39 protein [Aestuariirhabdus sp. Z084]|uniref:glycosyltransferase family 39 protein n=1 Tax=Aestuariirhabdus haliotis TaxID=2918751 RepID=UPI00201B43FF|nr:glycosyltransferase family 39 protein [Aestuariirhabdus haliotis]MCL6415723.1 glycosyltransferase family 39 protein [Aestuariirhabdus haliotis]MCL6419751.1 glycosyltransferase family 39 protein [Aestuariirhabdus haliotis]
MASPSNRMFLIVFFMLLAIAAYFRLTAITHTVVDHPIRGDARDYYSYALNMNKFGIYSKNPGALMGKDSIPSPDAARTPGYGLFLSLFVDQYPTKKQFLNITLAQALVGVITVLLVLIIARQLMPLPWAVLAAVMTAISPQHIVSSTYFITETLFSFFLIACIYCLQKQFKFPLRLWLPVVSGVLIGLAALTRPTLQYYVLAIFPLIFMYMPKAVRLKSSLLLVVGFSLVMSPWLIRNVTSLGEMSDSTLAINGLVHGHYPNMMYNDIPESYGYPYRYDPEVHELSTSISASLSGIYNRALSSPKEYLEWYILGKPQSFFSWNDAASTGDIYTYPVVYTPYFNNPPFVWTKAFLEKTHPVWIILALLAVVFCCYKFFSKGSKSDENSLLSISSVTVVYFLAIHMVTFPLARYCIPILPIIYLLSSYVLYKAFSKISVFKRSELNNA